MWGLAGSTSLLFPVLCTTTEAFKWYAVLDLIGLLSLMEITDYLLILSMYCMYYMVFHLFVHS